MGRLHDRVGHIGRGLMLDPVEPDLRPGGNDVEIAGMRHITHIESALDVLL